MLTIRGCSDESSSAAMERASRLLTNGDIIYKCLDVSFTVNEI